MSDKIDQRIVEMSFENEKFEKGISQSKNSLKEFSDVLKNTGMSDNFSGLEKSVTSLSGSFSVMEQIGIGALRRIGEAAVNAGAQMVKSLSIDQVTGGFSEYELKINTIRAIMNSTGETADSVREKIKSLDDYADKTIFSTKDMFDNLSTFTNAGISLDRATTAMIGIANATAYAGQGATSAMYAYRNFSDAISNGYMSLMDWRSISRVAKIGTQEMRQEFLKTAVELGTLTQAQIDSGAVTTNFEDTLKDQWMTADVVTETLRKYGDATTEVGAKAWAAAQEVRTFSGMMESLKASVGTQFASMSEIIFGDLNEAKRNFTSLYNILAVVFTDGLKNTNAMLSELKDLGGISNIFEGIKNIAVSLLTILKPISQAFDQIFPPKTVSKLLEITESFKKFTASLLINKETADKIQRTFAGLFAVIDIGWQAFKFLSSAILEVVKIFLPLGNTFLGASANLGDLLVNIDRAVKSSKVFQYALLAIKVGVALLRIGLGSLIDIVKSFISGLWNAEDPLQYLKDIGSKVFSGLVEGVKMAVNWLSGKFTNVLKVLGNLFDVLATKFNAGNWSRVFNVLKEVVAFIGGKAVDGFQSFGDVIKNLDFHKIATFVAGGVLLIFVKQLSDLTKSMTGFTNAGTALVKGFTKKFFTPKMTTSIHDMAVALGVLTASIFILSRIPADDLKKSLIGLAEAVTIFVVAYGLIQGINVAASKLTSDKEMTSSAFGLVGLSAALLIMSSAIKTISKIDNKQVWNATAVLGVMLGFITAYQVLAALISKIPGQQKVTANLFGMSAGILALVGALALLNLFSVQDLTASLGKMTIILIVLSTIQGLFAVAAKIGGGKKVSVNILTMAVGIAAMVGVMKLLSIIDSSVITGALKNLAILTLILGGMEAVLGLAGRIGGGKKSNNNILMTQLALAALVGVVAIIGVIPDENITKGIKTLAELVGLIGALELFGAIASRLTIVKDKNGNLFKSGKSPGSLIGVILSVVALGGTVALLGAIPSEIIKQGMLTITEMVGLIAALELIGAVASKIGGGKEKISSLVGVVAAIVTLTGALLLLSAIDQPSLRSAVISLGLASAAVLALSIAIRQMSNAVSEISESSKSFGKKISGIGFTLVAVGALLISTIAFFGTLKLVMSFSKDLEWGDLAKFITGLTAVTGLLLVLNSMPLGDGKIKDRLLGLIPGFVGVAGVLLATIGFFGALKIVMSFSKDLEWEEIGKFAAGLGVVMVLLGAIALLNKAFIGLGAGGINSLIGIGIAIVGVAGVVLATVGLAELLNSLIKNKEALTNGLALLTQVGVGIGEFVGGAIGGLIGGVLEGFGISLANFVKSLDGINWNNLSGLGEFAKAILVITASDVLDGFNGLKNLFTGTSTLERFGTQLGDFVLAVKDISPGDASKAASIITALSPMADALGDLASAAKNIPNSGGWLGTVFGNNDLKPFIASIADIIPKILPIGIDNATLASDILKAMNPMAVSIGKFASASSKIPNSGGKIGAFFGENDLKIFIISISDLIPTLLNIGTDNAILAASTLTALTPMADAISVFANAASKIPNDANGFFGSFLGTVDLPTFTSQIQGLVRSFGTMNTEIVGLACQNTELLANRLLPTLNSFSTFNSTLNTSSDYTQLVNIGYSLKTFINTLSKINFDIVGPAMDALSKVAASFEIIGADVINNAKESFDNNKVPFQTSIATILDEPIAAFNGQKKILLDSISSIFTSSVEIGKSFVNKFVEIGKEVVAGLNSGISSKKETKKVNQSMTEVMNSLIVTAQSVPKVSSPSKVFEGIGAWCTIGLAKGIIDKKSSAVAAGILVSKDTEEGIRDTLGVHSLSDLFAKIGEYIPKSLGIGLQNGKTSLLSIAKELGIDTSNVTLDTIADTIAGGDGTLTSGIKSLLGLLTGTTTDSAEETGTSLGSSLTGAFNNALSGFGGAETKVKTELEKLKDLIDEREFYGTITLEQELEMYQNLRSSYAEGSEERKQIDREIYTRLKTIYEAQLSYIDGVKKAETEAAQKIKDLKEKYDQDVLDTNADANEKSKKEETSYYENLNSILENAEKERQKLREDYAKNQKSINDKLLSDIESQNEAYENAVKSRAQSIYNSYNLFDAVGSDQDYSGTDLLDNLQSQVNALTEWEQSLRDLANRGVGEGLIKELQNMGPSSKAQINALLTLTDDQLSEYVNLFEQKYALANDKATAELTDLKNTTQQNIQDLKSQAAVDLYDLETEFNDAMTTIDTNMASDMSKLRTTHAEAMDKITSDLETKLTELETTWKTESTNVQTEQEEALKTLKNSYSTTMKEISGLTEEELLKLVADNKTNLAQLKADTEAKLAEVEKTYEQSATNTVSSFGSTFESIIPTATATLDTLKTTVKTTLDESVTDFEEAGLNAATGFANGITNGVYKAVSAAQLLAQEAVSAAQKILDEHSPSAVFEGIGKFVSMGFANGIIAYANKAQEASETMANGSIALVSQALSDMSDSDDLSPEITPVLNLGNIKTQLSSLFSSPVLFGSASSQLAAEAIQNGSEKSASATVLASIAAKLQQLAQQNSTSEGQSSQGTVLSPTFIFQVGGNVDKGTAKSIVEQVTDEFETYMALQGV